MNLVRKVLHRLLPYEMRRRFSDWRHRGYIDVYAREEIIRLNAEIDELRADQRRVAQLMDVVEQLTVRVSTNVDATSER